MLRRELSQRLPGLHAAGEVARIRAVPEKRERKDRPPSAARSVRDPCSSSRLNLPSIYKLVAGWLAQKENYQWLDFGDGRQLVSPEWLKIAAQRGTQVLRLFTSDDERHPSGSSGSANINPHFKTGNLWIVLGEKQCAGRGLRQPRRFANADARIHRARTVGHQYLDCRAQPVGARRRARPLQADGPAAPVPLHRRPRVRPAVVRPSRLRTS